MASSSLQNNTAALLVVEIQIREGGTWCVGEKTLNLVMLLLLKVLIVY